MEETKREVRQAGISPEETRIAQGESRFAPAEARITCEANSDYLRGNSYYSEGNSMRSEGDLIRSEGDSDYLRGISNYSEGDSDYFQADERKPTDGISERVAQTSVLPDLIRDPNLTLHEQNYSSRRIVARRFINHARSGTGRNS